MRILLLLLLLMPWVAAAQRTPKPTPTPVLLDPRGPAEVTVCSQNLQNYGPFRLAALRDARLTPENYHQKELALIERFVAAGCDVIALQELIGKTDDQLTKALQRLADLLRRRTNRFFDLRIAPSNDKILHNAYLVAKDRAEILSTLSYRKVELPKISFKQRPRYFSRGPFEMQISVKGREGSISRNMVLVTFHFKSAGGSGRDPAGLSWESYRMEMAEGLRRIVESRHAASFGSPDPLLLLLGDRNSHTDQAASRILEGVVQLNHFRPRGPCRLTKRGVPLCQGDAWLPQRLFSLLTLDPQTKLRPGTYQLRTTFSWIDDILAPAETLRFAWSKFDVEGDYDSGVVGVPANASDHALVWARFNW